MSVEERDRIAELWDAINRKMSRRGIASHRQMLQVVDGGSMPTTVPAVYKCVATGIDVDESEGATPTIVPDTSQSIPLLVLGPQVPVVGDNLLARVISGRWVAGMQGGASSCLVTICVTGCSRSLVGAVQVKSGSTVIASGTTDSTGCVTLDVGTAGTYTVVAAATNFNTNTASRSLTCGGTTNVSLTVASGRTCIDSACCPGLANTLFVTDGLGTTSLALDSLTTWDGVALPGWAGTGVFTMSGISFFHIIPGGGTECIVADGDIQVYYQLFCLSNTSTTSTWSLERYWGEGHTDSDGTGWYYGTGIPGTGGNRCVFGFGPGFGGPQAIGSATITKATSCSPFAVSGTTSSSQNHLSDPGGGVFSVSE